MAFRGLSGRFKLALAASGLAAALAVVGGVSASATEPVGDRIGVLFGTPSTYPAGQAFHIRHGWGIGGTAAPEQAGIYEFRLDVDGLPRVADGVFRSTDPSPRTVYDAPILNRGWLFNFPEGLTGQHVFTGHWIAPCKVSIDELGYTGTCRTPADPVEVIRRSVTVDFVRSNLALGKAVTASREYPGNPAALAVDGSWWSYWNSGDYPPQWIEVDLGSIQRVGEIDLGITQLPDCQTTHRLYGRSSTSEPYVLLQEFNGYTVDQQVLRYVANPRRDLRFVRIETTSSCSWVAWREIEVYATSA